MYELNKVIEWMKCVTNNCFYS